MLYLLSITVTLVSNITFIVIFFLSIMVTLVSIIIFIVNSLPFWSTIDLPYLSVGSCSSIFCVVVCGSLLVVLFFFSAFCLNSYKYQEIAHIYLQDNLFGVVDIAFTSNECYYRFNHCRIKSLNRGLVFPAIYLSNGLHAHRCER